MSDKILQKKCPRCGTPMKSHIPDDEFLEMNIRIFKTLACVECVNFTTQLAKLNELTQEAWVLLNRKKDREARLLSAKAAGTHPVDTDRKAAVLRAEISDVRQQITALEERQQRLLSQRSIHEQQLKGEPVG